jgi:hypothetical protein
MVIVLMFMKLSLCKGDPSALMSRQTVPSEKKMSKGFHVGQMISSVLKFNSTLPVYLVLM